jgi:hypothetical protein
MYGDGSRDTEGETFDGVDAVLAQCLPGRNAKQRRSAVFL